MSIIEGRSKLVEAALDVEAKLARVDKAVAEAARIAAAEQRTREVRASITRGARTAGGVAAHGAKLGWTVLRTLVKG